MPAVRRGSIVLPVFKRNAIIGNVNCENVQCALYTVAVFVGSSLGRKAYNLDQNRMRTDLQGRLGLSSVYMLLILQY